MTDYLIISDTHGKISRINELVEYRQKLLKHGEVLNLIFLGDGLSDLFSCKEYDNIIVHAVRGNCDAYDRYSPFGEEIPLYRSIYVGKYKVFITHGHAFSVKESKDELCREAAARGADIVLFGHTHVGMLEYIKKGSIRGVDRDFALFNPGALSDFYGSFGNLSVSDDGFLLSHGKYYNIVTQR